MKLGNLFDRTRTFWAKKPFGPRWPRSFERETNDGDDDGVELWAIKEREEKEAKESSLSLILSPMKRPWYGSLSTKCPRYRP